MGYVMMIVGIYLIVNGIGDYAGQSRQKDWIPIEATVTETERISMEPMPQLWRISSVESTAV